MVYRRRAQIPPFLAVVDRHRVDDPPLRELQVQSAVPELPVEQRHVEAADVEADHQIGPVLQNRPAKLRILFRWVGSVSIKEGHLYVAGRQIPMLSEKEPGDVTWGDLGVDVVIEATARKWSRQKLEQHLARGAKRSGVKDCRSSFSHTRLASQFATQASRSPSPSTSPSEICSL